MFWKIVLIGLGILYLWLGWSHYLRVGLKHPVINIKDETKVCNKIDKVINNIKKIFNFLIIMICWLPLFLIAQLMPQKIFDRLLEKYEKNNSKGAD